MHPASLRPHAWPLRAGLVGGARAEPRSHRGNPLSDLSEHSAPHALLQVRRIALTDDLDLAQRRFDGAEVGGVQYQSGRAEVFLQPMQLGGTGDRHDPRLLGQ